MKIFSKPWLVLSSEKKEQTMMKEFGFKKPFAFILTSQKKGPEDFMDLLTTSGFEIMIFQSPERALEQLDLFGSKTALFIYDLPMEESVFIDFFKGAMGLLYDLPFLIPWTPPMDERGHVPAKDATLVERTIDDLYAPITIIPRQELHSHWERFIENTVLEQLDRLKMATKNRVEFVEMAESLWEKIQAVVLEIEERPESQEGLLNNLYGHIHTLKGGSGFMHPRTLERFLFRFEDRIHRLKASGVTLDKGGVNSLLSWVDQIQLFIREFSKDEHRFFSDDDLDSFFHHFDSTQNSSTSLSSDVNPRGGDISFLTNSEERLSDETHLKVPISRLDNLMQISGEQTVIRNIVNKLNKSLKQKYEGDADYLKMYEHLEAINKLNSQIQAHIYELRKVSAKEIVDSLRRNIRDLAYFTGKLVRVKTRGEEQRIDTSLSGNLKQILIHMVRNCIDHGIEKPEDRMRVGKAKEGTLNIEFDVHDEGVKVVIADDGQGLSDVKIRRRAVELNLVGEAEAAKLTAPQLWDFIFEPGFSTSEQITDLSGRGIGMNAVRDMARELGGDIEVRSVAGQGATFTLTLLSPRAVFIARCLLFRVKTINYGVIFENIYRIHKVDSEDSTKKITEVGGRLALIDEGATIPLFTIDDVLGSAATAKLKPAVLLNQYQTLILLRSSSGDQKLGLFVDSIIEFEDTVINTFGDYFKNISSQYGSLELFMGTTYLGDGTLGLILNIEGILKELTSTSNFGGLSMNQQAFSR